MARAAALCTLLAAAGGQGAAAAGAASWGAARNGVCSGTGYMNIGWSGMSKQQCLDRGEEVARCNFLSVTESPGPVQATNFCRCFSSCEGPLSQPAGETWETVERSAGAGEGAAASTAALTAAPTEAPTAAPGGDTRQGLCQGSGYMNVGWSGMSRSQCLARAYEVEQSTGQCSSVSFSQSPGPVRAGNFCRCFRSCEGALLHPAGESWETSAPQPESSGGNHSAKSGSSPSVGVVVASVVAGVVGLGVAALAAFWCYRCRQRRARDIEKLQAGEAEAPRNSAAEVPEVVV